VTDVDIAHLWIPNSSRDATSGAWVPLPLDGDALALHAETTLHRSGAGTWVVVGSPAVRVNGAPLDAGIRVLRDRDELRIGGRRTFFSTETLAAVVPFPDGERPVPCARCTLAVASGSPAVRCPQCRLWHHQSEARPCWAYAERCTACDQPTALDAGFRWTPEPL
jgi:hypothetical protein